jgi:hypothetical protein
MAIIMHAATSGKSSVIIVGFMDISDESIEGDMRGIPVQRGTIQTGHGKQIRPCRLA